MNRVELKRFVTLRIKSGHHPLRITYLTVLRRGIESKALYKFSFMHMAVTPMASTALGTLNLVWCVYVRVHVCVRA